MRYSGAEKVLMNFTKSRGIPISENIAGWSCMTHCYPNIIGPVGVVGSSSANAFADLCRYAFVRFHNRQVDGFC